MSHDETLTNGVTERQRWMSILARAAERDLDAIWRTLGDQPVYRVIRPPEVGLVMIRGRAGGTGRRFNLGEMTVTRCAVQLAEGAMGHAWVGGRGHRSAEIAAVLDALLQDPAWNVRLEPALVRLSRIQDERRRVAAARAASTRVEFFTMVRGEA